MVDNFCENYPVGTLENVAYFLLLLKTFRHTHLFFANSYLIPSLNRIEKLMVKQACRIKAQNKAVMFAANFLNVLHQLQRRLTSHLRHSVIPLSITRWSTLSHSSFMCWHSSSTSLNSGCLTDQPVWFPVDFQETFSWKFSRICSFIDIYRAGPLTPGITLILFTQAIAQLKVIYRGLIAPISINPGLLQDIFTGTL